MIKGLILSTEQGLVIYSHNTQLVQQDLAMALFKAHKDFIKVKGDNSRDMEFFLDGANHGDQRYKIVINSKGSTMHDSYNEHVHVASFEDNESKLFGVISFCSEEYKKDKRKIVSLMTEIVRSSKNDYKSYSRIDENLTKNLDDFIMKLNSERFT